MKNEKLRTSNIILKALNEDYYVLKAENGVYDVRNTHLTPDSGWSGYFRVYCKASMKKSVIFNDKKYTNVSLLLDAVKEYNNSLFFPSMYYDPMYNKAYLEESKIDYYLKELGFSLSEKSIYNGSSYIYSNEFGKGMLRINVFPNREYKGNSDIAGELSLYFNENTCTHIEYKNGEDAVSYINSLITTTSSINIGCFLNVMRALRGELNKMTNAKVSDITNILDIKMKDYREEMIPILEKILEKLKEE
jgi:hypothetical protein